MGGDGLEGLEAVEDEPGGVDAAGKGDGEVGGVRDGEGFDDGGHAAGAEGGPGAAELFGEVEGVEDVRRGDRHAV